MDKEVSAGGVVVKDGKVLLILMNTISKTKVWTFPKGHIEKNETPLQTALREVLEETGVKCITESDKEFFVNNYIFSRENKKVLKTVYWYLMKPIEDTKKIETPNEIEEVRWVDIRKAKEMLVYESDKKMVDMLIEMLKK
ncbi:MAG: NUDIX hydrolase [Elusimicrobiales bacterium]|nr:NUDIX hydrolase [Elusimicrobiales bacterium]